MPKFNEPQFDSAKYNTPLLQDLWQMGMRNLQSPEIVCALLDRFVELYQRLGNQLNVSTDGQGIRIPHRNSAAVIALNKEVKRIIWQLEGKNPDESLDIPVHFAALGESVPGISQPDLARLIQATDDLRVGINYYNNGYKLRHVNEITEQDHEQNFAGKGIFCGAYDYIFSHLMIAEDNSFDSLITHLDLWQRMLDYAPLVKSTFVMRFDPSERITVGGYPVAGVVVVDALSGLDPRDFQVLPVLSPQVCYLTDSMHQRYLLINDPQTTPEGSVGLIGMPPEAKMIQDINRLADNSYHLSRPQPSTYL
jgi:hypothetical protein